MTLEALIANINKLFYLREFSFSRNQFTPHQESELEFSDSVIWLDDLLITLQLKERNTLNSHTVETEISWFKNQVLKKATKQIKDTLRYLNTYPKIEITNGRGTSFDIIRTDIKKNHNAVIYSPHILLPNEFKWKKFHRSSTAGFIHLVMAEDYIGICQTLFTPAEISEYLNFREAICSKYETEANNLPEQSLLGQFLKGDLTAKPQYEFHNYLIVLNKETKEFDLLPILHNFLEKTVRNIYEPFDYYRILKELAKLKRTELKEVKERFFLCVEKSKENKDIKPYRVAFTRTDCGFMFYIVPKEWVHKTIVALENYTYAHKYDQKLSKCIGISVYRDGEYLDVGWCLIDEPWRYDEIMEKALKENFPFREVKKTKVFTYHFEQENQ